MPRTPEEHRLFFREHGYTVFERLLDQDEVGRAVAMIDQVITPDTRPPVVTGADTARRQLNSAQHIIPELANYGFKPALMEAAQTLAQRPVRLSRSPVPTVTYTGRTDGLPGPPGTPGPPGGGTWRGHVDWSRDGELNTLHLYGIVHFTRVEQDGGGFTVVPGSHRVVARNLAEHAMTLWMLQQDFVDFPGLGPARAIQAEPGDVLFYHPLLVHGASDNLRPQPRKVLHIHYFPRLDEAVEKPLLERAGQAFHPDHLAAMDDAMRRMAGL